MRSLRDDILEALSPKALARVRRIHKNNRRAVYIYTHDGARLEVLRWQEGSNGLLRRITDAEIAAQVAALLT